MHRRPEQFRLAWLASYVLAALLLLLPLGAAAAPYAAMVIDARTGEVLHSRNAETRLHPASLTKMMTLYITFEAVERGELSLDTEVTISRNAASEPPSKLGLKPGQKIAIRYLIRAAAVKSANDAATALGEAVSGSEAAFARRMNRTAKAIGMRNSTFRNAHGLTADGHLSTAEDMTLLGRRLFYDYPQYYNLFSRRSTYAGIKQVSNTNRRFLGSYTGADGIKTGYTRAAGFNLVASAERGQERVIVTVFGGRSSATRNAKVAELMDLGFRRAPSRVAVRKPAKLPYIGPAVARTTNGDIEDAVAEATGSRVAGKTIRIVTAIDRSQRPTARPAPAAPPTEMIAALKEGVDSALANAIGGAVAAETASAVEAAQPARIAAIAPIGRPARLSETEVEVAVVAAIAAAPAAPATLAALAEVAPAADEPALQEAPASVAQAVAAAVPAPVAAPAAASAIRGNGKPTYVTATRSLVDPRPREVVTRASTSGGRHWAITLGKFPSRDAAERILLKTALAEIETLDQALRKVIQRSNGFEANFVGLSEERADLACRRLAARQQTCLTVGP
ncbi:D-alanyl-D-alanine carboxypeptidase [Brevirhabdus pacifica]|nr:D-alanyl-D-alanine carboxypeptidase [Brevirhabdus pacifica]